MVGYICIISVFKLIYSEILNYNNWISFNLMMYITLTPTQRATVFKLYPLDLGTVENANLRRNPLELLEISIISIP